MPPSAPASTDSRNIAPSLLMGLRPAPAIGAESAERLVDGAGYNWRTRSGNEAIRHSGRASPKARSGGGVSLL